MAVILTKPKGFLFWVVTGSGDYASFGGAWLQMTGRALGNSAILVAAGLGFLLPVGRRLWLKYRHRPLPVAGRSTAPPPTSGSGCSPRWSPSAWASTSSATTTCS